MTAAAKPQACDTCHATEDLINFGSDELPYWLCRTRESCAERLIAAAASKTAVPAPVNVAKSLERPPAEVPEPATGAGTAETTSEDAA
jgi:hypothetical protein